jgi:hypothetical protein
MTEIASMFIMILSLVYIVIVKKYRNNYTVNLTVIKELICIGLIVSCAVVAAQGYPFFWVYCALWPILFVLNLVMAKF